MEALSLFIYGALGVLAGWWDRLIAEVYWTAIGVKGGFLRTDLAGSAVMAAEGLSNNRWPDCISRANLIQSDVANRRWLICYPAYFTGPQTQLYLKN